MIPLVKPYIAPKEEMMPALERVLYSGYIAEGEDVYQFESEFGELIQNPNAELPQKKILIEPELIVRESCRRRQESPGCCVHGEQ